MLKNIDQNDINDNSCQKVGKIFEFPGQMYLKGRYFRCISLETDHKAKEYRFSLKNDQNDINEYRLKKWEVFLNPPAKNTIRTDELRNISFKTGFEFEFFLNFSLFMAKLDFVQWFNLILIFTELYTFEGFYTTHKSRF